MRGKLRVIELLNEVLTAELTAVNQYFIHAKMCDNWGYERLGKHNRDESIGEMKDADELIERILYLEGVPNLQRLGTVMVGETVPEQLNLDLQNERDAIDRLNRGIALLRRRGRQRQSRPARGHPRRRRSTRRLARVAAPPRRRARRGPLPRPTDTWRVGVAGRGRSATEPGRTLRVRGGAAANPTPAQPAPTEGQIRPRETRSRGRRRVRVASSGRRAAGRSPWRAAGRRARRTPTCSRRHRGSGCTPR